VKNVVFLGSKQIGLACLKILYQHTQEYNYKIVGVLTNKRGTEILNFCDKKSIKVLSNLDEYLKIEKVDIAISVQYHEILKEEHIRKAKEIIVNLHMAPLPEYRGCNQFSFAIYNDENEFGATIHKLEAGIDSGAIIAQEKFSIPGNITVMQLYDKTVDCSINLFKNSISDILLGKINLVEQCKIKTGKETHFYYRKDIEWLKKINLNMNENTIDRILRATSMNGFEPPYIEIKNKKVYLIPESQFKKEDN